MRRVLKYLGMLLVLELLVGLGAVIPAYAAGYITVNPTYSSTGVTVTAQGSGFTAGTAITLTYDGTPIYNTSPSTITADAEGNWSASFTLTPPTYSTTSGTHTISGGGASRTFTISPIIYFTPVSGGAGTSTTIKGLGFYSSETITLNFNGTSVYYNGTVVSTTSDTTGSWSAPVTIPSLAAGYYTVYAVGSSSGSISSSSQFQVISTAAISASQRTGQVGNSLSITGSGFLANETITATFDGTPLNPTATASSSGGWTLTVTIPPSYSGAHTVSAYGSTTSTSSLTGITYNVTPSFTIDKNSGSTGTSVKVSGTGFASGEQGIQVTIDDNAIGSPVKADANGSWSSTFTVQGLTGGQHTINARGSSTPSSSNSIPFTVGAGISLNKNTGTAGTSLSVSGSGFVASEPGISITFDGNQVGSTQANDKGLWTATITVPASAGGAHTITAFGPSTISSSIAGVTFTVQATITPPAKTSGPVGTALTLSGAGFAANETGITVTYDKAAIPGNQTKITADGTGNWSVNIIVPPAAAGSHDIKASGPTTQVTSPASFSFSVVSGISLSSDKGNIGGSTSLSGSGFAASSPLKITWDDSPFPGLGTVTTDDHGSFTKSITIPKTKSGDHTIKVTDSQNNSDNKTFNIDSTPPQAPKLSSPPDGDRIGFTGSVVTTFKWVEPPTPPNAPVTYTLQVDNDPEFASPILEKTNLDANSYTLPKSEALSQGTYYWRVKAIDAASNSSQWSPKRELDVDLMSMSMLVLLIVVVVLALAAVVYILIIRPRAKARRLATATAPEIVIPEVVNAEYRTIDPEEQTKRRALPWRLALPQAPPTPKGSKNLSAEDQARLKVIVNFAKALPLVEPGSNTYWLVEMAETLTGNTASPPLYSQIIKGEIQLRYEPAWMKHPTFQDLQTLLEGQPLLQDLNSFIDTVNSTASESVSLLQDISKDVTSEVNWDILANGGWAYISGIYADSLSWFQGKHLREPSERDYTFKPEGQNSEGVSVYGLYGEANTPFSGLLVQSPGDEEAARLRTLHMKLRRVYRNNDRGREICNMITQLDLQRSKLMNAFGQFSLLSA